MNRTFATRRHLSSVLCLAAAFSSFAACIPFDTDDDFYPQPFPEIVTAAKPPPPISGGTLAVSGDMAVAADPDRDRVWIVNLTESSFSEVLLNEDDEPGRVVIDDAGRAHVALRRGGALVTIDIASAKILERRAVCAAPRGVAFDKAQSAVHVACVGGELVTFPAAGGEATRKLKLDSDLRDIVVAGDKLLVSRFRAAEIITVEANGAVAPTRKSPPSFSMFKQTFESAVAWRTVGLPNGGVAMLHQRAMTTPVEIETGGYTNGGCDGSIVHGTVTSFPEYDDIAAQNAMPALPFTILPVDVAISKDGQVAVASAGTDQVIRTTLNNMMAEASFDPNLGTGLCSSMHSISEVGGEPIAVAFDDVGNVIAQTREPSSLVIVNKNITISLPGESRKDTGHEMFHTNSGGFSPLACATCHPEGRDDGRTWNFNPIGPRRTQFISGGILATAPLHWDGDMSGLDEIMSEVFVKRMGGVAPGPRRTRAFGKWIDALPPLAISPAEDVDAVSRGETLFNDVKVGCASCHGGVAMTNNKSENVGTGKVFQVPTLKNLAVRAPYMHDGCAATLKDRFKPECGGGDKHGVTSHLTPAEIDDLVAYLETL